MRNSYTEELLDQYEAFYIITRTVAMLGTQNSEPFDRDAQMLIDFCGQVYGWRPELIDASVDLLLGDMMRLGLMSDYSVLASAEMLDEHVKDNLILYEIKAMALEEANRAELICGSQLNDRVAYEIQNRMSSRSFHHVYEPRVRYAQFKSRTDSGESAATLQTALLQILGIGCEKSTAKAQKLLERTLLWGGHNARAAAKILAFLWLQENNPGMVSFYETIFAYLSAAAALPDLLRSETAEHAEAAKYCVLIAAMQSVINKNGNVRRMDVMFADLINGDEIPFSDKLAWICRYWDGTWLKSYISDRETVKIGF